MILWSYVLFALLGFLSHFLLVVFKWWNCQGNLKLCTITLSVRKILGETFLLNVSLKLVDLFGDCLQTVLGFLHGIQYDWAGWALEQRSELSSPVFITVISIVTSCVSVSTRQISSLSALWSIDWFFSLSVTIGLSSWHF